VTVISKAMRVKVLNGILRPEMAVVFSMQKSLIHMCITDKIKTN